MRRRDLSKILLASSATAVVGARTAAAQACTAPCYPQTQAEITAGVTPTNLAYLQGDVRRYGADPSGSTDSTVAIQNAMTVGGDVYIPAGQYQITQPLNNKTQGRRIYGDGQYVSILRPSGAISTLVNWVPNIIIDGLAIWGDSTTLDGITQSPGSSIYSSVFQNLFISTGGRAFYFFEEFSIQLINCHGSSANNNVFELQGGNTTHLVNCYAHHVPAGFYGYRLYCGAQLDSCNGLDNDDGGDWGLFGANPAAGDPTTSNFYVTLTNCNVEDFNNYGLRFRGAGYAKISGGAVQSKRTGTYQAEFYVEYTNNLLVIENVNITHGGATRGRKAAIYADHSSYIMIIGNTVTPVCDVAGVVESLPCLQASVPTPFNKTALHVTNLDVDFLFNRYAGSVTLAGGSASVGFVTAANTNYVTPQFDTGYCVSLTGYANETFYVTQKATTGFTIMSSNPASTATVDWTVVRPVTIWPYVRVPS